MPFPSNILSSGTYGNIDVNGIVSNASNVNTEDNPEYTLSDFYAIYPQFNKDANGNQAVPETIIQMYINLASTCISKTRWGDYWNVAMCWFIAHFCTLHAQSIADPGSNANAVVQTAQAKGLDTSVSAGGVSVSTDYSAIAQDLDGWAQWKLTAYGQQLASVGKLAGMGNMMVW